MSLSSKVRAALVAHERLTRDELHAACGGTLRQTKAILAHLKFIGKIRVDGTYYVLGEWPESRLMENIKAKRRAAR
jgi:hypothetical protein